MIQNLFSFYYSFAENSLKCTSLACLMKSEAYCILCTSLYQIVFYDPKLEKKKKASCSSILSTKTLISFNTTIRDRLHTCGNCNWHFRSQLPWNVDLYKTPDCRFRFTFLPSDGSDHNTLSKHGWKCHKQFAFSVLLIALRNIGLQKQHLSNWYGPISPNFKNFSLDQKTHPKKIRSSLTWVRGHLQASPSGMLEPLFLETSGFWRTGSFDIQKSTHSIQDLQYINLKNYSTI